MTPEVCLAEATPHARPVRSMKKERRYVKDGSGRCHVFLVSAGAEPDQLGAGKWT